MTPTELDPYQVDTISRRQMALDMHGKSSWGMKMLLFLLILIMAVIIAVLTALYVSKSSQCITVESCAVAVDFNVKPGSEATPLSGCQNGNLSCIFGANTLNDAIGVCRDNACKRFIYDSGARTIQLAEPTSKITPNSRKDLYYIQ